MAKKRTNELTALTNSGVSYTASSRYFYSSILKEGSEKRVETWDRPSFPVSSGDKYHTITKKQKGRLDLIAEIYYGDLTLWWIIAVANNIKNPLEDMVVGSTIRIPNLM